MSLFEHIPKSVPNSTFLAMDEFRKDTNGKKVNLCPGIYHDDDGKTWVLPSVRKVTLFYIHPIILFRHFEVMNARIIDWSRY